MHTKRALITVFGKSDVGRARITNEDAFLIADLLRQKPIHDTMRPIVLEAGERGVLLAVSDGMGAAQAGEVASALTLSALRRGMAEGAESAQAELERGVLRANAHVVRAGEESGQRALGATITAALIYDGYAYVAEVGDSRAYVLRNGRLSQVTHDQIYVQQLMDAGMLTKEQGASFPYRNVLSQAIGAQGDVVVAMNRFVLRRRDRLFLCSDGLTGSVVDAEIEQILATPELDAACTALIAAANSAGGPDNITVVLADVDGDDVAEWCADTPFANDVVPLTAGRSAVG